MSWKQESAWIYGWGELYEELKLEPNLIFVTSDWLEMSKDETFGFIQDEAYAGYHTANRQVWFKGKKALQYYRGKAIK